MPKRIRQYTGLLVAILSYYLIHEGAHFLYAFVTGTFRQVNILGLGVQIDVFRENMTDLQLGLFCLAGSLSTTITACALVLLTDRICAVPSRMLKACMYYTTIGMLLIDPLYLSILSGFFGGGDMNGISLLIPEVIARSGYGILLAVNFMVFRKMVLPKYTQAFQAKDTPAE